MVRFRHPKRGDDLTIETLKALLHYDQRSGIFLWKKSPRPGIRAGTPAGTRAWQGYWQISIHDRLHKAHRLAWFYTFETWPIQTIDHIDGDRLNNRISNLRDVSLEENLKARHRKSLRLRIRDIPAIHC